MLPEASGLPPDHRSLRKAPVVRKGPLWIAAGILVLVPLYQVALLNGELLRSEDPSLRAERLVETQHWKPTRTLLGETPTVRCAQQESTRVGSEQDYVQVLAVDADQRFWFEALPVHRGGSNPADQQDNLGPEGGSRLRLFGDYYHEDPEDASLPTKEGASPEERPPNADSSPFGAAQRILSTQLLGLAPPPPPPVVLPDGSVPPDAQDQWTLLGKTPLQPHGDFDNKSYLYTYLWEPQQGSFAGGVVSLPSLEIWQALQDQRFDGGLWAYASLGLGLAATTSHR